MKNLSKVKQSSTNGIPVECSSTKLDKDFLSTFFTNKKVRPRVETQAERAVTSRYLTKEDVAMVLELRSCGVPLKTIAYYVWNITADALTDRLKTWNAV
jgi:hypothetical protein|tara:strand:+ start:484 stop:780 length:297 start_codon:yes stop_codon:yes gene_type:complete